MGELNERYLYCLYNPMFRSYGENVYKLGQTKDPKKRLYQYTTGYIEKSEYLILSKKLDNKSYAEKILFSELDNYRIDENREFFNCHIEIIKNVFKNIEKSSLEKIPYNIKKTKKFKKKNIKLELLNEIFNNIDFYLEKINEYLFIPNENKDEYKNLIIDKFKLQKHFNIRKFFFNFNLSDDFNDHINNNIKQYVNIIIESNNNKMNFIYKMLEMTEAENYNPKKSLNEELNKDMWELYKKTYRTEVKKPYDFTNLKDCSLCLSKCYKNLFGDIMESKRSKKNINKGVYEFTFNKEVYEYHKKLNDFKFNTLTKIQK